MRISAQRLAAMATVAAAAKPSKVYVVTGATDGIGRLTAQKLGADGLHVAVHGRTQSKVDAVVAEVEQNGGSARGFVADLSSMADVRRLGAEIAGAYDAIDGLLNNAGTFSGDYTGTEGGTGVIDLLTDVLLLRGEGGNPHNQESHGGLPHRQTPFVPHVLRYAPSKALEKQ